MPTITLVIRVAEDDDMPAWAIAERLKKQAEQAGAEVERLHIREGDEEAE